MPAKMVQSAKWNAAEYAANSAVQQSWARELIARLKLRGDEHVLDVGCGDGKITAEIARAVPRGAVLGADASTEMVGFAKKMFPATKNPNLKFSVCDAREIALKDKFDVLFSNAALHWVDDHEAFLRGAAAVLKPGGRLVISCGGKGNAHDVFLALRPVMRLKRWCGYFRKMPMPYFFYTPADYEKWLPHHGFKINAVILAPKDATYDGAEGLATWLRSTWLPFVQRVPEAVRDEFITAATERYLTKHPIDADNKVHVRMVRLEIDALKL
ncbi:MAG TPA: methyltransferase domain-containing protein [Verrucomicrobiae bacterium]|nr:methyltransferase domain-containing protein [Verrucomicrobiae bacterium]